MMASTPTGMCGTFSWRTMLSVFDRMAFPFGGIASIKGTTTNEYPA